MPVYREIYCRDCNKVIGRYNAKYYTEARVGEVIKMCHAGHVKLGHIVEQRHRTAPAHGSGRIGPRPAPAAGAS